MQITQARWDLQPRYGYLYIFTHTQGAPQCFRRSRGRRSAPPNNARWASAIHSQESNWDLEVALPAGDTQKGFSVSRCLVLSSV